MWTPSSLALRPPAPHRAGALFWRPSPLPRLRLRPGGPPVGRLGTGPGRMARMAGEPVPSRSGGPAVSRLGENDWRCAGPAPGEGGERGGDRKSVVEGKSVDL